MPNGPGSTIAGAAANFNPFFVSPCANCCVVKPRCRHTRVWTSAMVLIIGGQRYLPVPQTPTQRPKSEDQRCMPPATRCRAAFSRDVPFQDIAIARSRRVFGIIASLCQAMLRHIDAVETGRYLPSDAGVGRLPRRAVLPCVASLIVTAAPRPPTPAPDPAPFPPPLAAPCHLRSNLLTTCRSTPKPPPRHRPSELR
jgi:hypothetical protein